VLPFEFTALGAAVSRYVDELDKLVEGMRKETEEHNRMLDAGAFVATAPPDEHRIPPPRKDAVPYVNLAPLRNAVVRLEAAAREYSAALGRSGGPPGETVRRVNRVLMNTERALTRDEGLPNRSWFRHFVYAPGLYTGYGVKTLPAVREAIEQREWGRVDAGVSRTAEALLDCAAEIEAASRALGAPSRP
jgi:N-acetylated-alpha-linked acidic dipeptidase